MFRVDAKVKNGTVDESHLARSTTVQSVSVKGEGAQPGAAGDGPESGIWHYHEKERVEKEKEIKIKTRRAFTWVELRSLALLRCPHPHPVNTKAAAYPGRAGDA